VLPPPLNLANYEKYKGQEETNLKTSGKDSGLAEYVKHHKDNFLGWEIIHEI
jgi:hypothetical protein